MFENRPEKKCYGTLGVSLAFCDDCSIAERCLLACYEKDMMRIGLCGICENFRNICGDLFCVRDGEVENEDGDTVTVKEPLSKVILACNEFSEDWTYSEDDEDADKRHNDAEYRKLIDSVLGPRGKIYEEGRCT